MPFGVQRIAGDLRLRCDTFALQERFSFETCGKDRVDDNEGFDEFVRSNERRLWQSLVPLVGPTAAEDAVADALMECWRSWARVRTMENPVGYAYTIARRRAVRQNRAPVLPAPDVAALPDVEPRLLVSIDRLSEMQRQVVYLVDGFGWGLTDAARILGISVSTVRNHRERGLARLRELLKVESDV